MIGEQDDAARGGNAAAAQARAAGISVTATVEEAQHLLDGSDHDLHLEPTTAFFDGDYTTRDKVVGYGSGFLEFQESSCTRHTGARLNRPLCLPLTRARRNL